MKRLVICDTNIFIDLWTMNLIGEFFMLPYEIHTIDMVVEELMNPDQKAPIMAAIEARRLLVESTDSNEINDVLALIGGGLSITDATVWYHAKKLSALMLTGDNRLRTLATNDDIRVAGILFILEKLITYNIVPMDYAAKCLEVLKDNNSRLPKNEVEMRLIAWTQLNINQINKKEDNHM